MCGIIGFIGSRRAAPVVLKGLQKLEYRGYDSAGLATISDGKMWFKKGVGNLAEAEQKHRLSDLSGNLGIGHVRWATHGRVTTVNSHPHFDCKQEIAVVHNGIVENYRELFQQLHPRHKFVSETDTEVIPHLIEEYIEDGASLEEALFQTVRRLKGSYAILAISAKQPQKIVAARKGSPLVIGISDDCNFVASDVLSFLEETTQVIPMEDKEIAVLTKDKVALFDGEAIEVKREPEKANWKWDEATKQGYDSFMLKEIMEQPESISRALMQDKELITGMAMDILRMRQVVFTACGSSRYAALIGRYIFSKIGRKFCDVVMASECQYFSDSVDKNTLVLAVSQSGETADVLEGAKMAKMRGCTVFSVVNRVSSPLAKISDKVIYLNCGPEISVAATKSFMSQITIFYLLSFAMVNKFDECRDRIRAISPLIGENLQNGKKIAELAWNLREKKDFYYIARGGNMAIAGEGALKLKEVSYVHADGIPSGELKHGSLALIENGTPVVVICPQDYTFHDTMSNVDEAKARGAFVIGVSDHREESFDTWIEIPQVDEIFYPLVSIVPLQLLAYHSARARGLDPDKPRNLAKSVTVK